MKCPLCRSTQLTPTRYVDIPVRTCLSCEGYLVQKKRVGSIKSARKKSDEELLAELSSPKAVDTIRSIICPSCTGGMTKVPMSVGTERYHTDECRKCDLVWFDAGELAKLQLHYEESEQGNEMLKFQKKLSGQDENGA